MGLKQASTSKNVIQMIYECFIYLFLAKQALDNCDTRGGLGTRYYFMSYLISAGEAGVRGQS